MISFSSDTDYVRSQNQFGGPKNFLHCQKQEINHKSVIGENLSSQSVPLHYEM